MFSGGLSFTDKSSSLQNQTAVGLSTFGTSSATSSGVGGTTPSTQGSAFSFAPSTQGPGGGGLFSNPSTTTSVGQTNTGTSLFGNNASGNSGITSSLGTDKVGTTGLFNKNETNYLSTSDASGGAKKFLPGRPSLHDILTVAPDWKSGFESICKDLSDRDNKVSQLRNMISDLKSKNDSQKISLSEKIETAKADTISQNWFLAEIEANLPAVRKLRRQVTALSSASQRTIGNQNTAPQPLVVPQSDYLRFIDDLQKRVQKIEKRAELLEESVSVLKKEFRGENPPPEIELKNTLSLLMAQFKQLKFRQLGLHEELKVAIDRYKYTHPRSADIDFQLQGSMSVDNIGYSLLSDIHDSSSPIRGNS